MGFHYHNLILALAIFESDKDIYQSEMTKYPCLNYPSTTIDYNSYIS